MKKFGFLALILSLALVGCKPKEETSTTTTTTTPAEETHSETSTEGTHEATP